VCFAHRDVYFSGSAIEDSSAGVIRCGAKDRVLAIREEMQSSQEELKSANEEMQSANEELQSTNEELTSSKEKMQSLNEELHTVNQKLQSKVSDLSLANNDMINLLNSTDIATLFLDEKLNIRRFTNRPIVTDLAYPDLADDAREVLRSLVFSEKHVPTVKGDRWFNVRIMPYRTLENRIDGLVLTFSNMTESRQFEDALRQADNRFILLMEALSEGVLIQNGDGQIITANIETSPAIPEIMLVSAGGCSSATPNSPVPWR
jgi:two-component system CheB/CheR fusion protein